MPASGDHTITFDSGAMRRELHMQGVSELLHDVYCNVDLATIKYYDEIK